MGTPELTPQENHTEPEPTQCPLPTVEFPATESVRVQKVPVHRDLSKRALKLLGGAGSGAGESMRARNVPMSTGAAWRVP